MEPIYKTVRFGHLPVGCEFKSFGYSYIKTSARSAKAVGDHDSLTFAMQAAIQVEIVDAEATAKRDKENAKPVFDGTEASCRTREDFYALDKARRQVEIATEAVDKMADFIAEKMASIKKTLRRHATERVAKPSHYVSFEVTPGQAVEYTGLNSCGELQGNGNIDMAIATLLAKREAFTLLVHALGYRVGGA